MTSGKESFPLWGGVATVMVTEPDLLGAARRAVDQVIADIDAACGPHRGDSDLARVHAAAGGPVQVGATFHAVLWTALYAAEVTGGLVDPLTGGARDGGRSIRIDEPQGTVALPPGTSLDIWDLAKAFAADRAAELAAGRTGGGVLVSFPGNVSVYGPVPAEGWRVRVADGRGRARHGRPCGRDVVLRAPVGLAARGPAAPSRAATGGEAAPHVVDLRPRLRVRGPWRAVSVMATTCVAAGTASAAALVCGHAAVGWLVSRELSARLVCADGSVTTVGNWPADPAAGYEGDGAMGEPGHSREAAGPL